MPKIITYVECDCEKGRLKKFSETAFEVEQNRIFKSDEFWQCDHCKEIFHREISIDTRYNLNRPDIDSDYFEEYNFFATKEELIVHAELTTGYYSNYSDELITKTRDEKLALIEKFTAEAQILKENEKKPTVSTESESFPLPSHNIGAVNIGGDKLAWCSLTPNIEKGSRVFIFEAKVNIGDKKQACTFAIPA